MNYPDTLLFAGKLYQESAACVGGNGDTTLIDHVFAVNGNGEYTIKGQGIAGAMLATCRHLFTGVHEAIEGGTDKPSAWKTFALHPEGADADIVPEYRTHVSIEKSTLTQLPHSLHDEEVLPTGTCWPFLVQLNLHLVEEQHKAEVLRQTIAVLDAWAAGYCWLGRAVSLERNPCDGSWPRSAMAKCLL